MLLIIPVLHFAKRLTEISESLTYDGITNITLLAIGTLFSTVWTETNLSYAQLLQPDTNDD